MSSQNQNGFNLTHIPTNSKNLTFCLYLFKNSICTLNWWLSGSSVYLGINGDDHLHWELRMVEIVFIKRNIDRLFDFYACTTAWSLVVQVFSSFLTQTLFNTYHIGTINIITLTEEPNWYQKQLGDKISHLMELIELQVFFITMNLKSSQQWFYQWHSKVVIFWWKKIAGIPHINSEMTRTATSIPSYDFFRLSKKRVVESSSTQPILQSPINFKLCYEVTVNLRRRIQSSFSPSLHTANHHFSQSMPIRRNSLL